MIDPSLNRKSLGIIFFMVTGLALIYPKIIHSNILYILGYQDDYRDTNEFIPPKMRKENKEIRNSYLFNKPAKDNKIWTLFIPIYGAGLIVFLLYNMNKVFFCSSEISKPVWNLESIIGSESATKTDDVHWNGLSQEDINYWSSNNVDFESGDDPARFNKIHRQDVLDLLDKINNCHYDSRDIKTVFTTLQYAESKLLATMASVSEQSVTIVGSDCGKGLLEDDYMISDRSRELIQKGYMTASEGESE